MGGIKIIAADAAFSKCVRKRAGWSCERCGTNYGGPSQALHCAHYHGRGKWATRFDPRNAASLCYGCHMRLTAHPYEASQFFAARLGGVYGVAAMQERANDLAFGRRMKREAKAIAAHYRAELERMCEGEEFVGY